VTKKASEQTSQIEKGTRNTEFFEKEHIQLADQSSMNMTTQVLNTVTSHLKPKNVERDEGLQIKDDDE
jgi:hypothetical protein